MNGWTDEWVSGFILCAQKLRLLLHVARNKKLAKEKNRVKIHTKTKLIQNKTDEYKIKE